MYRINFINLLIISVTTIRQCEMFVAIDTVKTERTALSSFGSVPPYTPTQMVCPPFITPRLVSARETSSQH